MKCIQIDHYGGLAAMIHRDIAVRRLPSIVAESVTLLGGILVIIMCSFGFVNYLIDAEVPMRILDWSGEAADHPRLLAVPETHYLKCAVLQAL